MKDRTVDFDGLNSADYFGVTLIEVIVDGAEPKLLEVDVPFSNGTLDLTNALGKTRYNNRNIEMVFHVPIGADHWILYSKISNAINGKKTRIRFSADDQYFYEGRVMVGALAVDEGRWGFPVSASVFPYKKKMDDTVYSGSATGTLGVTISCVNSLMDVIPEFNFSGPAIINFNGETYTTNNSGTFKFSEIVFTEGENTISIKGQTGTISYSISYKEGSL